MQNLKFKIKIDSRTMYYMAGLKEVGALFAYWKEEEAINGWAPEHERVEVEACDVSLDEVAKELGELYLIKEYGELVAAMRWDEGFDSDAYLMLGSEETMSWAQY